MKRKFFDILRLIWKIPFLEKLLVKKTINKPFGIFVTKLPPNHYQYKKSSIREVTRNHVNYKLDISDIVDWFIYFGFKETSRESLLNLIDENQTIIDIGANVGNVSLQIAYLLGDHGHVHSFEPDPLNFKRIEANVKRNDFKNIQLNNLGLGNEEGSFHIATVNEGNQGMNRIVGEHSDLKNLRKIEVTTLDNYVEKNHLKKINLIKIDVEGFEYNVLMGALNVIKNNHPIFFIELDDNNLLEQGHSAKKLIELLERFHYEFIHAETKEKISSNSNFKNCHFDIIAKFKN